MSRRPARALAGLAAVLLGGLLAARGARAQEASARALLDRGNEAYAKGDFASAEKAYREILAQGMHNGHVYYNLGNACFRRDEIGSAILFYEKALRLDPSDADARENLRYAMLRIRDRIPTDSTPFLIAFVRKLVGFLNLEQVTSLFVGLYLLAAAAGALWIVLRRKPGAGIAGMAAGVLLLGALLAAGWMVLQAQRRNATDEAIVLSDKLEVYSGPGNDNTLLASVHEGTKVTIHAQRDLWCQVTLPDGRAGWLLGEGLGVI